MPVVKLTKRFVEDLLGALPPEKDVIWWDQRTPGFGVKVKGGSGRVSWCMQWRDPKSGTSHRLALGDAARVKLDAARKAAEARFGEIAGGKNPIQERKRQRAALTFGSYVETVYLASPAWRKKAPSTRLNDEYRIRNYLLPALGAKKLAEITLADVRRLLRDLSAPAAAEALARKAGAKRTRRGGEGGARRTMRLLKAILAHAVEEEELEASPAATLALGGDGTREDVPDDEAYDRLWSALERLRGTSYTMGRACDCIALIALTGARRAEIQQLRWRHVDLDGRRLVLGTSEHKAGRKTGKSRIIALPDEAMAILAGYPRGEPEAFVFAGLKPDAPVALQRPWERIAAQARLPAVLTLHNLRHGLGTKLAAAGMAAPQIAMALGHAQWRTSERYVHAVDRARAEVAQKGAELVRPKRLRTVS